MSVWKKTERVKRTDTSITSEIVNLVNKTSKLITELTIVKKDGFGTFRGINVLLRTGKMMMDEIESRKSYKKMKRKTED